MTEQTVNVPLLRKAVEWAEAEAAKGFELSEWYQPLWNVDPADIHLNAITAEICGTDISAVKSPDCGTCYCIAGFVTQAVGGDIESAEEVGEEQLGLSASQACALFAATNTIEDVRRIAESIAGERL